MDNIMPAVVQQCCASIVKCIYTMLDVGKEDPSIEGFKKGLEGDENKDHDQRELVLFVHSASPAH